MTPFKTDEADLLSVMDIEIDNEGRVWFATNGKGIIVLEEGEMTKLTVQNGLNSNTVNKLIKSDDGAIYAGTTNGIFVYREGKSTKIPLLDGVEINDMLIDDYQNLWLGCEQGIYKLNLLKQYV